MARPYAQWLAEQKGTATWKTPIQQDVDAAIASALTWKQFLRALEQQGYTFRFDRKYTTLKLPGDGRTVRFKTLGKQYTPEAYSAASFTQSLFTGLEKNHQQTADSCSCLGKSLPAGSPAYRRFTFPIYTR